MGVVGLGVVGLGVVGAGATGPGWAVFGGSATLGAFSSGFSEGAGLVNTGAVGFGAASTLGAILGFTGMAAATFLRSRSGLLCHCRLTAIPRAAPIAHRTAMPAMDCRDSFNSISAESPRGTGCGSRRRSSAAVFAAPMAITRPPRSIIVPSRVNSRRRKKSWRSSRSTARICCLKASSSGEARSCSFNFRNTGVVSGSGTRSTKLVSISAAHARVNPAAMADDQTHVA